MIGKISNGKCFRGLVNYLLDPSKTPQIIDTNLAGIDRNTMIWELNTCAEQRPSCKKPVKHISVGFATVDGEVEPEAIEKIAMAIVKNLGYGDNQYLVVHHDRIDPGHDRAHDHDHFHILINMINFDGERVRDSFDKQRLEKIIRQQELEHNLTQVPLSAQRNHKAPSTGQVQRMMKEIKEYETRKSNQKPQAPYMAMIQSGIDVASQDKPSLKVFLARLQGLGIDSKFCIEEGIVKGISYKLQDFKVRGCKLHRASLPQLLEHRVLLDPEQDLNAIAQANRGEEIDLAPGLRVSWNQTRIKDYIPNKIKTTLDKVFGINELKVLQEQKQEKTVESKPETRQKQGKEFEMEI
jgi:uncharacterized protein YifN (PemK superfamily)